MDRTRSPAPPPGYEFVGIVRDAPNRQAAWVRGAYAVGSVLVEVRRAGRGYAVFRPVRYKGVEGET